jgi:hypothetical protein
MLHLKLKMSHYTEAQSTLDVGVRVIDFFGLDGATNVERLKNYDVLSL